MSNLNLSKLRKGDVPKMLLWGNHDDLRFDHYNFPVLNEMEMKLWYHSKNKLFRKKIYKVENDDKMVGFITIKKINWVLREAEMGIVFDPDEMSKGYGTQGIALILQEYFHGMKMKRLWLRVAAFNKRAINAYIKAGFKLVKVVDEPFEEQGLRFEISNLHKGFDLKNGVLYTEYFYMDITKERYCRLQEER